MIAGSRRNHRADLRVPGFPDGDLRTNAILVAY